MKGEDRGEAKRCAPSGKERKAGDQRDEGAKGRAYLHIFARLSRSQSDPFGSSTLRRVLQMPARLCGSGAGRRLTAGALVTRWKTRGKRSERGG